MTEPFTVHGLYITRLGETDTVCEHDAGPSSKDWVEVNCHACRRIAHERGAL